MQRTLVTDRILKTELLLVFGIVLFTILGRSNIVSILFYSTFFILMYGIVSQTKRNVGIRELCALGCILFALISVLLTMNVVSFSYFKKLIIFACTILLLMLITELPVSKKTVELVLKINIAIAVLYPLAYYVLGIRTTIARGITFNFSNPNLTGIYLLHSALYVVLAFIYFKNKIFRIGLLALTAVLCVFIVDTLARACAMALLGFALLSTVNYLTMNKLRVTKKVSFVLLLMPLLIAFAYLWMVDNGLIRSFDFLVSEGKPITSRYNIWSENLDRFFTHPFLGNYGLLGDGSGIFQLHNTHIDVLVSYGAVPFILFIIVLNMCINAILPGVQGTFQKSALFAFYAVIIMGSFEAALVSGGMGMYILSGGFLVIAQYQKMDS